MPCDAYVFYERWAQMLSRLIGPLSGLTWPSSWQIYQVCWSGQWKQSEATRQLDYCHKAEAFLLMFAGYFNRVLVIHDAMLDETHDTH